MPAAAAAAPSPTVVERGVDSHASLRLERIAGGALLTYARAGELRATMYVNGRWSPSEQAGRDNNRYRLVTADGAQTAAIVIEGSGEPVSVRFREAGGRFVADSPPLLKSGAGAVAANAIGMGGDGTLYAMVPEQETVQTGVPLIPEVDLQRLRVLVRRPGAGWSTVPDVARIFERALARYNAGDTDGASGLVASQLQPVSAAPTGGGDALLLWVRAIRNGPSVLEGRHRQPRPIRRPRPTHGRRVRTRRRG